tara:strand:- start:98 stop:412 length:315 start_codon:yes stop_codon:yes gene_type:complete
MVVVSIKDTVTGQTLATLHYTEKESYRWKSNDKVTQFIFNDNFSPLFRGPDEGDPLLVAVSSAIEAYSNVVAVWEGGNEPEIKTEADVELDKDGRVKLFQEIIY